VITCIDPPPIDKSRVDQTMVRCIGGGAGATTYTGVSSRRSYRVARGQRFWVLNEDLPRFRLMPPIFEVLEDTRIDPEKLRQEDLERRILDRLRASVDQSPAVERRRRKTGGRKAGSGFGAYLECLLGCGRLDDLYGSAQQAYDAIERRASSRAEWAGRMPSRERFAAARSDAHVRRAKGGQCPWMRHPEPWIYET
jgi:hypothetical protein